MRNSENQQTVFAWMQETFPGMDPNSPRKSIRLLEECIELCIVSGAQYSEIEDAVVSVLEKEVLNKGFKPEKIPGEVADVLIVLYGVAGMRGIDLNVEVDKKMVINRARKWKANGDGTGYHIKD